MLEKHSQTEAGITKAEKEKVPVSTRNLLNSLAKQSEMGVQTNAMQYMGSDGAVDFIKLQGISLYGRIPNLTHVYGIQKIHMILAALLTRFGNELNLIRPMTAEQIESCSFEMLLTSQEDQLAIEDYVLFFKGALQGKYGRILDRLDQQTVFTLLEEYREQRWQALQAYKMDLHEQQKALGPSERTCQRDELADRFDNVLGRMQEMKERLKEQRDRDRGKHFSKKMDNL